MEKDEGGAEKEPDLDALSEGEDSSLAGDFVGFLKANKKWWLVPIVGTLLLISVMLLLAGTAVAPFIYTLF